MTAPLDAAWPSRFGRLLPSDGARTVWLLPPTALEAAEAVADAHAAIRAAPGPWPVAHVPAAVVGRRDGDVTLSFECAAVMSLATLAARYASHDVRLPYGASYAFVDGLLATLARAHAAAPPYVLGALCWGDVLVGEDGRFWVVGWGWPACRQAMRDAPGFVEAPELTVGGALTPAADLFASFALVQSLARYTVPPVALRDALMGGGDDDDALVERMSGFAARVLARSPRARYTTVAEALAGYRAYHDWMGVTADPDALRRLVAEQVAACLAADAPPTLVVRAQGDLFALPDADVPLATRRALRLIALALVDALDAGDGRVLPIDALAEAGWPDERAAVASIRRRAYVAVAELRKLGFGRWIENRDGGYRLAPELRIVREP